MCQARDLRLSPDRAVFVDGALVPVRYLLNGTTIVQEPPQSVSYFHPELDAHDVLRADGLPCESYLDTGNRGASANGGTLAQTHPDFATCGRRRPVRH
ncbi:MAG: Hint domain-containing protein [Alphaproteobacteria bacterium]|nr:Hint domain-containing protein [Alphaproteobacteria bacterium]